MHGSNRGGHSEALGFLALSGLLIFGALVWGLGFLQGSESERRRQIPASYSRTAQADAQRTCVGTESSAIFECVYEKVEASQEQARGEQDLSAQQRAAFAALASAVLALLTLVVTGIGVWFVKRTLDATLKAVQDTSEATEAMRESNRIARESVEAQMRAWVSFEYQSTERIVRSPNAILFKFKGAFRNIGHTPAINFSYYVSLAFDNEVDKFVRGAMEHYRNRDIGWIEANIFHGEDYSQTVMCECENPPSGAQITHFIVVATYKTAFSNEMRFTVKVMRVLDNGRGDGLVDLTSPPPASALRLCNPDNFIGYAT